MNKGKYQKSSRSLRYAMLIPLALFVASLVTSSFSYSDAKRSITEDLNETMLALANENSVLWTRQDTIAALRHMHETTHKPLIYQASDLNFRNSALKDEAYFTIALVDMEKTDQKIRNHNGIERHSATHFSSDSIMLVPENTIDGVAIHIQGFADCSMASVFATSDQTLPGILLTLSLSSMATMLVWRRKRSGTHPLEGIKLTPMQRQFAQMLLEAPDQKVDKMALCTTLWGNKSNAEESLYTLVKRTKSALADTKIEIICNRGESYELRINS